MGKDGQRCWTSLPSAKRELSQLVRIGTGSDHLGKLAVGLEQVGGRVELDLLAKTKAEAIVRGLFRWRDT